jgi:hypothetical protein
MEPLLMGLKFVSIILKIIEVMEERKLDLDLKELSKEVQKGFTDLQNSVGILQASTALFGVGAIAGVAFSAANLHQIMRLRKEVKQARIEIHDGFTDLKLLLNDQGKEILSHINRVSEDIKFNQQKLMMIQAYGQFKQGLGLISKALLCENPQLREGILHNALNLVANALATYKNPDLYEKTSAIAYLRRAECSWAMEQTVALIFQLHQQPNIVIQDLKNLQETILRDSLIIIDRCASEAELALIFPELLRIQQCDMKVLTLWQEKVEKTGNMSTDNIEDLFSTSPRSEAHNQDLEDFVELPEDVVYRNLLRTSHFHSLLDQLRFIFKSSIRQEQEDFIERQVAISGHQSLIPQDWSQIPDQVVANLYWYLQSFEKVATVS